jgi:uncharacterized protein YjbI with pentapeptide repeats
VFFAIILLLRAVTASRRQLLFDEPLELRIMGDAIKLPIDQPFHWFFLLGPIVFVPFHFFLMAQVWLLSHRAAAYNEIINNTGDSDRDRELMRLRLKDALSAQILVGATRERRLDWLLRAIAEITLALLPIGLILAFQIKFLPYHDGWATLAHRVLLFAELAIVFVLIPLIFDAGWVFSSKKVIWQAARGAVFVSFVAVSLLLAFPGERHLDLLKNLLGKGNSHFCETILNVNDRLEVFLTDKDREVFLAHKKGPPNFEGRDLSCGKFEGNFSGFQFPRAWMRGARFADAKLNGADFFEAQLPGADLRGADLSGAKLRGANLNEAHLERAILHEANLDDAQLIRTVLWNARLAGATLLRAILSEAELDGAILREEGFKDAILREAKLGSAYLDGTQLKRVGLADMNLEGANLLMARLEDADLSRANLRDADLRRANLNNAVLNDADLQGADLFEAELARAKLRNAKLQRARLLGADLQHADLDGAKLPGADLSLAKLQDAHLSGADLTGADLSRAQLQRADLRGADLTGAQLRGADLRGADLRGAQLQGADLRGADLRGAQLQGADLRGADLSKANLSHANLSNSELELAWIFGAQLSGAIGANCSKAYVKGPKFEARVRANRSNCEDNSKKVVETVYRQQHAGLIRDIVCNATADRREITHAMVRIWISDDPERPDFSNLLANGLLGCPADLSDEDHERLRKYAPTPPPVQ